MTLIRGVCFVVVRMTLSLFQGIWNSYINFTTQFLPFGVFLSVTLDLSSNLISSNLNYSSVKLCTSEGPHSLNISIILLLLLLFKRKLPIFVIIFIRFPSSHCTSRCIRSYCGNKFSSYVSDPHIDNLICPYLTRGFLLVRLGTLCHRLGRFLLNTVLLSKKGSAKCEILMRESTYSCFVNKFFPDRRSSFSGHCRPTTGRSSRLFSFIHRAHHPPLGCRRSLNNSFF